MSQKPKLVVRVNVYPHRPEETIGVERDAFEKAGISYQYVTTNTPEELRAAVADADAVISGSGVFDEQAFAAMSRAKVLVSCGVGLDRMDLDAAGRHDVMVCNMPDICTDEVADHAMALLLACNRKIGLLNNRVKGGVWDRTMLEPMPRLRGLPVGLLGFGRIAQQMAIRCQSFGMVVSAFDPYVPAEVGSKANVTIVDLPTLLATSEIVSCHLPHMPTTHHLMGEEQFRQMRKSATFINSSRGRVVDEAALVRALREKWIFAAGLDVLEDEPPMLDNPLLSMDNVLVTPHAAGFSDEVVDGIPLLAFQEVMSVLNGGTPRAIAWANKSAFAVAR